MYKIIVISLQQFFSPIWAALLGLEGTHMQCAIITSFCILFDALN